MKSQILAAIAALLAFKQEMKAKFNGQIEKLPPLEGLEVANSVRDVLWSVDWAARRMNEVSKDVDDTASRAEELMAQFEAEIAAATLVAAVEAKTHVPVADHDAALTAAREEVKTTMETEFTAKLNVVKVSFDRKAEAIAKLGPEAVAGLVDADFAAEDFPARLGLVEARVKTLADAGLTAESKPKVFGMLIAHSLDEEGTKAFDASFEILKEAAGGEFKASITPPTGPRSPGSPALITTPDKKKVVI